MADDDRYLTVPALAQYAGLSMRTLQRHMHAADHPLPFVRVGGRVLVRRSIYDAWVTEGTVRATPAKARLATDAAAILRSIRGR